MTVSRSRPRGSKPKRRAPTRDKQQLRRAAGELSIDSGIVLSLLVVDQRIRKERGDFSIFQNIRDEGMPV